MNQAEFLRELESVLEIPAGTMTPSTELADIAGWDSMSTLIFMSLADEHLQVTLGGDQIAGCRTVGDLLALVAHRLTP